MRRCEGDGSLTLTTVEQTREYIKKLFSAVLDLRSEAVDGKYDGIMQKAKTYINDHFEKDGISLNMVAAEVNLVRAISARYSVRKWERRS